MLILHNFQWQSREFLVCSLPRAKKKAVTEFYHVTPCTSGEKRGPAIEHGQGSGCLRSHCPSPRHSPTKDTGVKEREKTTGSTCTMSHQPFTWTPSHRLSGWTWLGRRMRACRRNASGLLGHLEELHHPSNATDHQRVSTAALEPCQLRSHTKRGARPRRWRALGPWRGPRFEAQRHCSQPGMRQGISQTVTGLPSSYLFVPPQIAEGGCQEGRTEHRTASATPTRSLPHPGHLPPPSAHHVVPLTWTAWSTRRLAVSRASQPPRSVAHPRIL